MVTIGIPLFNEEKYIEEAIRSAAIQSATVWVSDNASTDSSAEICERVSREYHNVHFVRQTHNMGAIANFKFVLDKAETPYFMWLGGHDILPDGYVRQLTQRLEDCPEAALSYGASHHIDTNGNPSGDYEYYYHATLANKSSTTRILGVIRHLHECSLIHGVFRTEALRAAWHASNVGAYLGPDHVLLTYAAKVGRFLYAPKTCLIRRDVHANDTPYKQLTRLDLRQPNREQLSRREMQRRQYELAATVSKGTGLTGLVYRIKARSSLVKRFGPFGDTFMARKLDTFLYLLASPFSNPPHNLFKILRDGFAYRVYKLKRIFKK